MATSPNFNWPEPDNTDLVKNGALAIRTAVNAIDTSLVDLKGGTTGQVLSKASGTDMDFAWVSDAAGMTNPMTTTGDTIYSSSGSTPARLGIGSTGQVLTVAGGLPTWASPAGGGGKVLQVVAGYTSTVTTSSSSTYADTTLTASITPSAVTSKILVFVSQNGSSKSAADSQNALNLRLLRGGTSLDVFGIYHLWTNTAVAGIGASSYSFLDSPATTSSTTYKTQFASAANTANVTVQADNTKSSIILMEIGA